MKWNVALSFFRLRRCHGSYQQSRLQPQDRQPAHASARVASGAHAEAEGTSQPYEGPDETRKKTHVVTFLAALNLVQGGLTMLDVLLKASLMLLLELNGVQ